MVNGWPSQSRRQSVPMKSREKPTKNCESLGTVGWNGLLAAASQTPFRDIGRPSQSMIRVATDQHIDCAEVRVSFLWCGCVEIWKLEIERAMPIRRLLSRHHLATQPQQRAPSSTSPSSLRTPYHSVLNVLPYLTPYPLCVQ